MSETPPPTPEPRNEQLLALLSDARTGIATLALKIEELTEENAIQTKRIATLSDRFTIAAVIFAIVIAVGVYFLYNELNTIEDMIAATQQSAAEQPAE